MYCYDKDNRHAFMNCENLFSMQQEWLDVIRALFNHFLRSVFKRSTFKSGFMGKRSDTIERKFESVEWMQFHNDFQLMHSIHNSNWANYFNSTFIGILFGSFSFRQWECVSMASILSPPFSKEVASLCAQKPIVMQNDFRFDSIKKQLGNTFVFVSNGEVF